MIPTREAQRLRRLLQRRLKQFEAALRRFEQGGSADVAPQPMQLEREAKALMALMKALQAAAEMEQQGADRQQQSDAAKADDALRRRLAQQLEALCAPTRPPRRGGGAG